MYKNSIKIYCQKICFEGFLISLNTSWLDVHQVMILHWIYIQALVFSYATLLTLLIKTYILYLHSLCERLAVPAIAHQNTVDCYLPWVRNQFALTVVNLFILLICVRFLDTTLNSCRENNTLYFSTVTENMRPQGCISVGGTLMACGLQMILFIELEANGRGRGHCRGRRGQPAWALTGAACPGPPMLSSRPPDGRAWRRTVSQLHLRADGPAVGLAEAVVVDMEAKLLQEEA